MELNDRIYISGHRGLVGSAIYRALRVKGYTNLLVRTRQELDLEDELQTRVFFSSERPDYVFLAAAKVGGILANDSQPADFIRANLAIQGNVIDAARKSDVQRLLFLGSSCIYPKLAPQPISESTLLTGPLEPTNRAYAVAKIAGIEMCWAYNRQYATKYLAAMPTNLYGDEDNFDLETSHVLPALIRKAVEAKIAGAAEMTVWGTGTPRREFLHSEDMAEACVFLMNLDDAVYETLLSPDHPPLINVGTGEDITIRDLAEMVTKAVDFSGMIRFDTTKPDGTPRKLLDVGRLRSLGWMPSIKLEEGIRRTVDFWMKHQQPVSLCPQERLSRG